MPVCFPAQLIRWGPVILFGLDWVDSNVADATFIVDEAAVSHAASEHLKGLVLSDVMIDDFLLLVLQRQSWAAYLIHYARYLVVVPSEVLLDSVHMAIFDYEFPAPHSMGAPCSKDVSKGTANHALCCRHKEA